MISSESYDVRALFRWEPMALRVIYYRIERGNALAWIELLNLIEILRGLWA
jgi:hypothetical protein